MKILKPVMPEIVSINRKVIERQYDAKFVGEFPTSEHSTEAGMLFYQEEIPPETYTRVKNPNDVSNYLFFYTVWDFDLTTARLWVKNGATIAGKIRNGLLLGDGSFIYSRHRHDFVSHGNSFIDGGDSYTRRSSLAADTPVTFKIVAGDIVLIEEEEGLSDDDDYETHNRRESEPWRFV